MNPSGLLKDPALFRTQCLVNGSWSAAAQGGLIEVDNPANGEVIGTVPSLGRAETEAAIRAAADAWPGWREQTAGERAACLQRWYALMQAHREDLARIMTLEQGKPLAESRAEIDYAASFLQWFAGEAPRACGDTIPAAKPGQHIVVLRQPVGVTATITPWNFPAAMITRKAGAALAAGCTVVSRPASATPFSALALGELGLRAGLPPGVFNVVTGPAEDMASTLTENPLVRKLSFTGSTAVGRKLMAACARHVQKISLELGGNAPFIVFEDADLDAAVQGLMAAKFRNTGQTCISANRLLVHDAVHDTFVARLREAMAALQVGDGMDEKTDLAPLINREAVEKVRAHLQDATDRGARVVLGGEDHPAGGNYCQPTLLTGVTTDMKLCHEETFGPLIGVMRFSCEEDAVRVANDTPFGLAAYFYTRDLHRAWRVAESIEAGMIGINEGAISNAAAPFGGVKESGLGREGSRYGIDEYLETKYLCMGAP